MGLTMAGPQKYLNMHGDNLSNVVQYMEREDPERFFEILKEISKKIPGINKISIEKSKDGRMFQHSFH
jgi:predicted ATPase